MLMVHDCVCVVSVFICKGVDFVKLLMLGQSQKNKGEDDGLEQDRIKSNQIG